jgi:guanosine-3',5'-bis(diphosphate) 3'-pyrophosphohydrolase
LIAEVGGVADLATLQAGVLHDTLEDTNTTYEELVNVFGQEVADIVKECSDDKSKPKEVRKREQIERAKHVSKKAKIVKLADKLHNLTSLTTDIPVGWSVERVQGYFLWSSAVIDNLQGVNSKLEDELYTLFLKGEFTVDGKKYPTIPEGDLDEFLEAYLADMAEAGKTEK